MIIMAKGYPDFFGFSVFMQYGSFQRKAEDLNLVEDGDTETVLTISGKGKIYFGQLTLSGIDSPDLVTPIITIDGSVFSLGTLFYLHSLGDMKGSAFPVSVFVYDAVYNVYALSMEGGITFVDSFSIAIENNDDLDCTVDAAIGWSEVI